MLLQLLKQYAHQQAAPYPAPAPAPAPAPSPSGNFPPGTLPQNQVPVDAQGNVRQDFINSMLTPTNQVDTGLFDGNHPSGLSKFARVGLRMLGHDMYDGQINGDVALRTLLAPDQSHNRAFTSTPETIDMVKEWGRRDLQDDGTINGSVYGQLIEDVWPTTDDVPIPGFADRLNYKAANLNAGELFRTTPDVTTPDGLNQWSAQTGRSIQDLQTFSFWGHRILEPNKTMQQIAQEAINDPTSIDFGLTHATPGTLAFAQQLANDPNAKRTVGGGVLNMLQDMLA